MPPRKTKSGLQKFWRELALIFLGVSFFAVMIAPMGDYLASSTLDIPTSVATKAGVPAFNLPSGNNDQLVDALYNPAKKSGLVWQIVKIAKYILGGIFTLVSAIYVMNLITGQGEDNAVKEFKNAVVYSLIGFLVLALAEPFASAFKIVGSNSGNFITNPGLLQQSAALAGFSFRAAAKLIQYILGGTALLFMGVSAFRILISGNEEQDVKNARKSLVWATLGLVIAGLVTIFVDTVIAPVTPNSQIATSIFSGDPAREHAAILAISRQQSQIAVGKIVKYFQTFIGAIAVFMLFLAGFKMISAGGEENIIKKQEKMITWVFLGLALILLAEVFVSIFMPIDGNLVRTPGLTQIGSFSAQMGGLTNFLLTFAGGIAVLTLVVGALYLTTAVANPEQAEKGKKIMLGAALGIIITISAYALVNTVLSGRAG